VIRASVFTKKSIEMEFKFHETFPLGEDKTQYHLLTKEYVSAAEFEGQEILKVDPKGLR
jgi:fumarate hydratase class I